jgi:3-oxoadipate enol-lactonase
MPEVTVGSATTEYVAAGAGPGLVLVHGTGGDAATTFGPLVDSLSAHRQVVIPNLPGSGASRDDGDPLTLDALAAQVRAAARDAGLERYDMVGYSLGAAVAARVAASRPQAVGELLLIAGWVKSDLRTRFQFDLWRRLFETDSELFVRFAVHTGFGPALFDNVDEETLEQTVQGFKQIIAPGTARQAELDGRVDLSGDLAAVTAPTEVIGFTHDRMVPSAEARALAAAIAGARYTEIDAGHLFPWEQPDRFGELLTAFAKRTSNQAIS